MTDANEIAGWAKEALDIEIRSLQAFESKIPDALPGAVRALLETKGKVIVCGLGKSGHVGKKIAASLASLGTPSFFLHATEALHGDLGMAAEGDALIALSNSGETPEVVAVARILKERGLPVVVLSGKAQSSLGKLADHFLDAGVEKEADPLNLAPTASATLALAIGDLLAVCVARARGFQPSDFAANHPGGKLGEISRSK